MTEDGNRKIAKIWYSINTSDNKSAVEIDMGRRYKRNSNIIKW